MLRETTLIVKRVASGCGKPACSLFVDARVLQRVLRRRRAGRQFVFGGGNMGTAKTRLAVRLAVLGGVAAGVVAVCIAAGAQAQDVKQAAPTVASTVDREVSGIEKLVLDAAEAMPEEKYNFSPEN